MYLLGTLQVPHGHPPRRDGSSRGLLPGHERRPIRPAYVPGGAVVEQLRA